MNKKLISSVILNILLILYIGYSILYTSTEIGSVKSEIILKSSVSSKLEEKPEKDVIILKEERPELKVELDPIHITEKHGKITVDKVVKGRASIKGHRYSLTLRLEPEIRLSEAIIPFKVGLYMPITANGPLSTKLGGLTVLYNLDLPLIPPMQIGLSTLFASVTKPWYITRNTSIDIGIARSWNGDLMGIVGVSVKL